MNARLIAIFCIATFFAISSTEGGVVKKIKEAVKGKPKETIPQTTACSCPNLASPVCGNDRVTYANPCQLKCAMTKNKDLRMQRTGACLQRK